MEMHQFTKIQLTELIVSSIFALERMWIADQEDIVRVRRKLDGFYSRELSNRFQILQPQFKSEKCFCDPWLIKPNMILS